MFSQLNDAWKHFFSFLWHVKLLPEPFYVHLTGGAGVRKSYLINVITEYVQRNLKNHGQKLEQSSIVVTASTSKGSSHINGLTLRTAFHLQINGNNQVNVKFRPSFKDVLESGLMG